MDVSTRSDDRDKQTRAQRGDPPVFPQGPPVWPPNDPQVRDALLAAWADQSWGKYTGRHGEALVAQLVEAHGNAHVKLCSSGTVGVELALRGLGIQAGDEVLLAAYDYPGNFRAIERVGAHPVLVDVDQNTLAVAIEALPHAWSEKARAIIVSHLHSGLAPMPAIVQWAREHKLQVIEDACQAPGATVSGQIAGSWGDIGVLSFGGSKLITAGRGGAVLVKRPEHYQKIVVYAEQGNDAYPLSELQAAVVLPQWRQLPARNDQRLASVRRLVAGLCKLPQLQFAGVQGEHDRPSYYKSAWWWREDSDCELSRDQFCQAMRAEGVAIDPGFRGFLKRTARRCRRGGPLPVAERAASQLVVLHHPILLEPAETMDRVIEAVHKVLRQ